MVALPPSPPSGSSLRSHCLLYKQHYIAWLLLLMLHAPQCPTSPHIALSLQYSHCWLRLGRRTPLTGISQTPAPSGPKYSQCLLLRLLGLHWEPSGHYVVCPSNNPCENRRPHIYMQRPVETSSSSVATGVASNKLWLLWLNSALGENLPSGKSDTRRTLLASSPNCW